MIDGHQRIAEGAEVAGRHGEFDAWQEGCGEEADRASARVAHDADARPVDVVARRQIVKAAIDVEHSLADEGAPEHQSMHRRVVTSVRGHLLLDQLAAFAERSLLNAERADASLHTLQPEVTVAGNFHGDVIVVALDGYRMVRAGRVSLDANEEGVRGSRVCGQAEEGNDIRTGFGVEHDFLD